MTATEQIYIIIPFIDDEDEKETKTIDSEEGKTDEVSNDEQS